LDLVPARRYVTPVGLHIIHSLRSGGTIAERKQAISPSKASFSTWSQSPGYKSQRHSAEFSLGAAKFDGMLYLPVLYITHATPPWFFDSVEPNLPLEVSPAYSVEFALLYLS